MPWSAIICGLTNLILGIGIGAVAVWGRAQWEILRVTEQLIEELYEDEDEDK